MDAIKQLTSPPAALKIGLGYGTAFGGAEVIRLLAGHGVGIPLAPRALVAAITLAGETAIFVVAAAAAAGALAMVSRRVNPAVNRARAGLETALIFLYAAPATLAWTRGHVGAGLPFAHPLKLVSYAGAAVVAAILAAVGYAAVRFIRRRPVIIAGYAGGALAALILLFLPELKPGAATDTRAPNVVFVSIDTLRRDHASCYGYRFATTPHLERLAREATLFENAVCAMPTTNPSHASMFTGMYPEQHGVTSNFVKFQSDAETLAQILRRGGYETVAVIGGFPLDRRISDLSAGFEIYDDYFNPWSYFRHTVWCAAATAINPRLYGDHRPAPEVTARAAKWITRRSGRPLFIFVHYFDPHYPYLYHGAAGEFWRGPGEYEPPSRTNRPNVTWAHYDPKKGPPPDNRGVLALYDDEIHFADGALGELLALVKQELGWERTLVVVAGDHGESFGEHNKKMHGDGLYDDQVGVPLIVKPPSPAGGSFGGNRVVTPVETLSIAYTVINAAGVDPEGFHGRRSDLLAPRGADSARPYGFTQTNTEVRLPSGRERSAAYMIRTADRKLIYDVAAGVYEFYDLARDPGEVHDLSAEATSPGRERLRRLLDDFYRREAGENRGEDAGGGPAEFIKSLGYAK